MWVIIIALILVTLYNMATFQDVKDAVTVLQAARETEKAAVAKATSDLQATIAELQALVATQPTPTEFQGVVDSLNAVAADLTGTV